MGPVESYPSADDLAPVRSGVLAVSGGMLLIASVAFSLVWFPVARTGVGTIAGSDAALIALWAVTALDLLVRGAWELDVETPAMVVMAIVIALLAAAASEVSRAQSDGLLEFMSFMKRFGLAAVIPLAAVRFGSRSTATGLRVLTVAAIAALVVFALRPELHDLLPKPDDWEEGREMVRAAGLGMNPNNLAYGAVALAILHGALMPRRSGTSARLLLLLVLAGTAVCVVLSGSRSGLVGAVGALAFLLLRTRMSARAKLGLCVGAAAALVVGLQVNPTFQERLGRLYQLGANEANVAGRMHAQGLAVRAAGEHPFGVGFRNIGWAARSNQTYYAFATSDSAYVDTLLGAGVPGLLAFLLLLRLGWRHVARTGRRDRAESVLQAGLVAFFVFSMATVVPLSVFLAPLFFTIISGMSHVPDRTVLERTGGSREADRADATA
jgi:O-antigen ligase